MAKQLYFDVIVGNPPYQGAKAEGAGAKGKPPTIWPKFVEIGDRLMKDDGMMILVHPAMYRKPGQALQSILHNNNRQLHMYNNAEAMVTFGGVSTRYDWYVIDKSYNGPTEIYFEDESHHTVNLSPSTFLPNGSWTIWQKIQSKLSVGRIETVKKSDTPDDQGNFEVIQTITKTKGTVIRKSSKMPKTYGIRKVILSETGCEAIYDSEGKYGMTSNCYMVAVDSDEEGEALVRFVKSDLCDHLVESCKWGNFRTECVLWHYIPNPYALGITSSSTESDIHGIFDLTPAESAFVQSFKYGACRPTVRAGTEHRGNK